MALYDRMTVLNARLSRLPSNFGDPRYRTVVLVQGMTQTTISPKLMVIQVNSPEGSRAVGAKTEDYLSSNIQIQGDEMVVLGIPRTYSLDLVKGSRYLIEGTRYDCEYVNQSDPLTYTALLRPFGGK